MNKEELNDLMEYNLEYTEAMLNDELFGGNQVCEVKLGALEKAYSQLQQENEQLKKQKEELKEWLEEIENIVYADVTSIEARIKIQEVLDKMNELEGGDND